MPRLTVLMPVRNGERFVQRAVDSVLADLPGDGELRVLDDASTDETPAILGRYSDRRLFVNRTEHALGVPEALNRLLESSDSEVVARMDADDVVLRGRFSRQLQALQRNDLVFSSIVFIAKSGRLRRPDLPGPISADALPLHLLVASCLPHPTMMARRAALPDRPYRSVASEDYDLWLRLAADGRRIARLAMPALLYRLHEDQVSSSPEWRKWRVDSQPFGVASAYTSLVARLGLSIAVTPNLLRFAQSLVPPESESERDAIRESLEQVRQRALQLPYLQRRILGLRLAKAYGRLRRSASKGPI